MEGSMRKCLRLSHQGRWWSVVTVLWMAFLGLGGSEAYANTSCPPGTYYYPNWGCQACNAGSYCPDGKQGLSCPAGTYQPHPAQTSCLPCPAGTGSNSGSRTCTQCSTGSYSEGGTPCIYCPSGTYGTVQGGTSLASCLPCPAGQTSSQGSTRCGCSLGQKYESGKCVDCPNGQEGNGYLSSTCRPCRIGTYWEKAGVVCAKCPAGTTTSNTGSQSKNDCQPCPAGTYSYGGTACVKCPKGSFSKAGATQCTSCPVGSYADAEGSPSCTLCKAGFFGEKSGADSDFYCTKCPRGYYSQAGAKSCNECPAGFTTLGAGSTSVGECTYRCNTVGYGLRKDKAGCEPCGPGTYFSNYACVKCPEGTYNPNSLSTSQTACKVCAAGSIPSSSQHACEKCPAGTFAAYGDKKCSYCPGGTFSTATGATSVSTCLKCPKGTYGSFGKCLKCKVGTYAEQEGLSACKPCASGSFAGQEGSESCKPCPAGQFSAGDGKSCLDCLPGTYNSTPGASSCQTCPPNTSTLSPGAKDVKECTGCPPGTIQTSSGCICKKGYYPTSQGCLACPVGSYKDKDGLDSCKACRPGTYADTTGSVTCKQCPANTRHFRWGSETATHCIACNPGFVNTPDWQYCVCPNGTGYSFQTQKCEACKPGSSSVASSTCTQCPAGTYSVDGSACTPCAAGTFSTVTEAKSASVCKTCPANTYSDIGKSSCSPCPPGTQAAEGSTSAASCKKPLPDLVLGTLKLPSSTAGSGALQAKVQIKNTTANAAGALVVEFFFSADPKDPGTAPSIGKMSLAGLAGNLASPEQDVTLTLPGSVEKGQGYIHYKIDAENRVDETNESNNTGSVGINLTGKPNLSILDFRASPSQARAGDSLALSFAVQNKGNTQATQSFEIRFVLSQDQKVDSSDLALGKVSWKELQAGGRYPVDSQAVASLLAKLPTVAPGPVYLIAMVDSGNVIDESDENDNLATFSFVVVGEVDKDKDGYKSDKDCDDNDKSIYPGASELCDGKDNNCDGKIDESFAKLNTICRAGQGACEDIGIFVCKKDGTGEECSVKPKASQPEVCDGVDNDCNGKIDDNSQCQCVPGASQPCYSGTQSTAGVGLCSKGVQLCLKTYQWGPCLGETLPTQETCDGKDNNCDGKTDEGCPCQPLGSTRSCGSKEGECKQGTQTCGSNGWGACSGETTPSFELCDGKDNNCDGKVDENFADKGKDCSVGKGLCAKTGKFVCKTDGLGLECDAKAGTPDVETCDGKDNDCDGEVDENLQRACYTGPEKTKEKGACRGGFQICKAGAWGACEGEVLPKQEVCDNGRDDDCNGIADDPLLCGPAPKPDGESSDEEGSEEQVGEPAAEAAEEAAKESASEAVADAGQGRETQPTESASSPDSSSGTESSTDGAVDVGCGCSSNPSSLPIPLVCVLFLALGFLHRRRKHSTFIRKF
ncbi:MAG: hypothetical protein EP343_01680 [Deltaproteobacteria bacterium]|nr:MAG: hypothetical protein EP343_01680 [Deltaproteobacteria bacterium]